MPKHDIDCDECGDTIGVSDTKIDPTNKVVCIECATAENEEEEDDKD